MSFRIVWEQDALEALDKLDSGVAQRILIRINWLASNFENIKPQALSGALKGYFKFRIGNYRVIYSLDHKEKELVIELLGHRRAIYKLP
jgi:mRNA interferase RelE/StbE